MLDMLQLRCVARRQDAALKAQLTGFFDARFRLGNAANFSREPDFAEKDGLGIERVFPAARRDRGDNSKIDRRLVDVDAAGDVDENILIEELGAHLFFQNRHEQGDAVMIDADRRSTRHGQE